MSNRILLHITFWLSYLVLQVYTGAELSNPSYAEKSLWFRMSKILYGELLILPIKAGMSYLVLYYFLPKFHKRLEISWLLQLIGATFIILTTYRFAIGHLVRPLVYGSIAVADNYSLARYIWGFLDVFSIVGVATAIKLFLLRQAEKEQAQALKQERLLAELQFLRSQANPHFLFNTLNNIYALARKKSEQTADVVLKLSKLLRFMLYECNVERIPISTEIKVIQDYIELEKLRYNQRLNVDLHLNIDNQEQLIAPLLLLPLVENAFKHGVSETRFDSFVKIQLDLYQEELVFVIENTKEETKDSINDSIKKEGIGLPNIERQLILLYPQQHQLEIKNRTDNYAVQLKIKLSKNIEK